MSVVKQTKYIFVLGGVMSGLGKGITASSIGLLFSNWILILMWIPAQ